ncbi:GntR family transcriptional regulator [Occultella aeris]|uniref:HTH-type transcriptional repressor YvoA n=2 Tax=Occultella aeris TaxID=2761496 RepID=A0A7M4DGT0_9MICO|nr:HTH-type transcriptional repressor YvoA [Occultella aeris]
MTMAATTDRRSPVARWGQIARDIRRRIEQRELAPGVQLPSENELAENYGVSRITVRQALSSLADEGYIHRRQGSGTFVSDTVQVVQHDLAIAQPWRDRLASSGMKATSVEVPTEHIRAPPVALLFDLDLAHGDIGPRWFRRLQLVDGNPIGMSDSWLAPGVAPGIESAPLIEGSLSTTLESRYGIVATEVHSYLHPETASAEFAEVLRCPQEAPLMVVNAVSIDSEGALIEASRTVWIGQRVRFHHQHGDQTRNPH